MSDDHQFKLPDLKPGEVEVVAHRFVLQDKQGRTRAVLQMRSSGEEDPGSDSEPGLFLLDKNGVTLIAITTDFNEPSIYLAQDETPGVTHSISLAISNRPR